MEALVIAVALAGLAVLALLAIRTFRPRPPGGPPEKVPPALRPGDTDDVLESDRLTRIQRAGFLLSVVFAASIFAYWLLEPGRMISKEQTFAVEAVDRGNYYFALAEDPVTGKPPSKGKGRATGRPVECARCHGVEGKGGTNEFLDPATGQRRTVQVPELQTLYSRYQEPPPGFKDTRTYVYETIERGRPGTDMPTWGDKFGGPLTDQQIDNIIDYMESIQKKVEVSVTDGPTIFANFCAPCHGQSGAGGSGTAMRGGTETKQFPNIEDHIAFVKAGSKPGQTYGTSGKGTGGMPAWGETLTEEQIRAVVEYERSL
ncbi:MAG: c-type cytochrome [Actinomycetota bacterium]